MIQSGQGEESLVPSKGNVSSVLANFGLVLNIANDGFKTGGEKGFSFPETGFFFAVFRVVTVCPGGLGDFFFPSNWYFSIFFAFAVYRGRFLNR